MELNVNMIKKNLGTFTNAFGLKAKTDKLVHFLTQMNSDIKYVGILLRDPFTKDIYIQCRFPINGDFSHQMIWVPINNKQLEVVPLFERYADSRVHSSQWKIMDSQSTNTDFDRVQKDRFWIMAHRSFRKNGIIEKYNEQTGEGFIRRKRGGIYFHSKWCRLKTINLSDEVSFLPIISRKGLNAMVIEPVRNI